MKLDYKKTFLIGFGFFASSLAWSLYNSFIPLMLREFVGSTALIGLVMTIDNVFGVIFQPLFGQLSDRTRTRFGKRMPYIMVGIPLCSAAFMLIPFMKSLVPMMAAIITFNFIMSTWRSPVIALMPDLTPSPLRSKANGIINLMGGVGAIVAFLVGGRLTTLGGYKASFAMGAFVMVLALMVMVLFVREPDSRCPRPAAGSGSGDGAAAESGAAEDDDCPRVSRDLMHHLSRAEKKSLFALLGAIFFWFCGFNAVETFFTSYATTNLQLNPGSAASMLTFFSLALVACAVPAGILAGRYGRRRMILIGICGNIAAFTPMYFVTSRTVVMVLMVVAGVFWSLININSLPMVVEMAQADRIGSFTGYYYFFSFSASIASPILFGLIHDLTKNYSILFVYSIVAFLLALGCMLFVRHGEAKVADESLAEAAGQP